MDPTTAVTDAAAAEPVPTRPITRGRFVGALVVASGLFFALLLLFAVTGLGIFGVAPALVVALSLTARITKIRRMSVLILLGVLAFLIVIVGTYAIAIAYILASQPVS